MKIRKKHIPVFLSVNNETVPYLAVTLKSISDHCAEDCVVDARILTSSLAPYNRRKLRHINFENIDITLVDINSRVEDYRADFEERLGCFYGEESFYPFFIADMYPRLAKALYVECGSVVRDDIEKIYHADIGDDLIGGLVSDGDEGELRSYRKSWVGVDPDKYLDCSAILINLTLFRKYRISSRFARLIMGYNFDTVSASTDYMNFLCKGKARNLGKEWGIENDSGSDYKIATFAPHLLPWHYVNIRYADEFWELARKTPFYGDVRDAYIKFDEDSRKKEMTNYDKLVSHAKQLSVSSGGFYGILGDNYLI